MRQQSKMTQTVALFVPPTSLRPTRRLVPRRAVCERRYTVSRTKAVAGDPGPSPSAGNAEDGASASAWAAWQRSRSMPEEEAESAPARDPDAETDFWRSAARELGSTADTPPRTQGDVWADAREVSSGVNELQRRLADELQMFDSSKGIDDYRAAAREIGTPSSADDAASSIPWTPDAAWDAANGAGPPVEQWTPDVAWEVSGGAAQSVQWTPDAAWDASGGVPAADAERKARDARTAAAAFEYSPPPGKSDGQYPRSPRGDATYETDFWRGAARELVPDAPLTRDVQPVPLDLTPDNFGASDAPALPSPATEGARVSRDVLSYERAPLSADASVSPENDAEERSAWAAFNDANERWAQALGLEAGPINTLSDGARTDRGEDWGGGDWRGGSEQDRWRAWDSAIAIKRVPRDNARASAGALGDDTQMWMQAARQVNAGGDESDDRAISNNMPVPRGQEGRGVGIEFWAKAAREIVPLIPAPDADEEGVGSDENDVGTDQAPRE
eukprot:IDg5565t1